jgi:hypothetical protein
VPNGGTGVSGAPTSGLLVYAYALTGVRIINAFVILTASLVLEVWAWKATVPVVVNETIPSITPHIVEVVIVGPFTVPVAISTVVV